MLKGITTKIKGAFTIFNKVDGAIKSAKKGFKYIKVYQSFVEHLESFNADRKKILGIKEEPETKTE